MSITSKFIKNFESNNEIHVKWLKRMIDLAESLDPSRPMMLIEEINKNPMKIELEQRDALDWPHIHFCLCAVYAKDVLRRRAWVPK